MPEHAKVIGHLVINKKQCKDCKEWKSIGYFYTAGKRRDGLGYKYQPYCKACDLKRSKVWTENNREKDRQNSREKRLKYKFHRPGYKIRQSNRAATLYQCGYLKLTKLQKENMIFFAITDSASLFVKAQIAECFLKFCRLSASNRSVWEKS